jgi:hypothetical protein
LGTGSGDPSARQGFAKQFASLWPYFEKISPKQGYLEGGLLFYPGTKPDGESAMPVLNKETGTYDFTPNITTFHIPVDSELGKQIPKSKMMVAATGYFSSMGSSDEERFPDAQKLSVPGIIVQGTTYVQDPVELDFQGLSNLEAFIKKNAKLIDNYLAPKPGLSNPGGELYSYLNKHLRTEGLLADFPAWANANMSAKKAQTLLSDPKGLQATLGAVEGLSKQKNVLIGQLSQGLHGGIKQTKPEGYAQAHPGAKFKYDIPGQFVKTIDQTNWKPRESVVSEAKGGKKAVIGWGRGMGHTGHDALVTSVIHQAERTSATPFFVVSRSFGKDDPIPPETKLALYQKKFPKYSKMFSLPSPDAPTLNDVLAKLAAKGYSDVTLVVGADQKEAFGYLTRPDKSGVPPYQKFGLNSLQIMSRQDTKAPGSDPTQKDYHEGPRATPMREVLLDPNKSEQEQFAVWRQAMSSALSDQEVLQMMNTAKENLAKFNMPKPKGRKLKEFIERVKPLLEHATPAQKVKIYNQLLEAKRQLNELGEPSSNNLANKVAMLIHTKKPEIFSRYGDEHVMDTIIDTCTNNPNKTEMELAIEALNTLKQQINEGKLNEFAVDGFEGGDHRSKILASVGRLFDTGNKVDWRVPGQMGHVIRVQDDGVTMKPLNKPHSRRSYFLPMYDDSRDKNYTIKMIAPKHYAVISSDPSWDLEEGAEEALQFATKAHAGQERAGGDPYISHPVRVANHIKEFKKSHNLDALLSAAYLHDTLEDTDTTQEVLHDLFGGLVASLVQELTSDPEQIKQMGKAAYLAHKMAAMSSYALVIKLADRLDNVKDITTAKTPQWRAKYKAETEHILDYIEKNRVLSGTHQKLIGLIRNKISELDNPEPEVTENLGLPQPGTYEETHMMSKPGGHRIMSLTNEDSDTEMDQVYRFAQQHYPNMRDKQAAFVKYVMHALKHSEQDDSRQDQEIQDLEQEVNQLQAQTKVAESSDYLDEK